MSPPDFGAIARQHLGWSASATDVELLSVRLAGMYRQGLEDAADAVNRRGHLFKSRLDSLDLSDCIRALAAKAPRP